MVRFTAERGAGTPDEIWLLEHPPVYTLGQAGRAEHLLEDRGIELIRTDRGGQITYHGWGQIVAYVLLDLRWRDLKVRELVARLEEAVIHTLARYNVVGERKAGAPGVYVWHAGALNMIAALGLRIRNGCSFHGLSLNVDMDLAPFAAINPCGYPGQKVIDLVTLCATAHPAGVLGDLEAALVNVLSPTYESEHHVI